MILLDVNVQLALLWDDHVHHEAVVAWFDALAGSDEDFGSPGIVWHAVVRLATNRKVINPPLSTADVFEFYEAMAAADGYRVIDAGPRHMAIFRRMCETSDAHANLVTDAAIAAIAVESGASLASFDRDFARFPELRWVVPGA